MSVVPAIAALEMYYKDYIFSCIILKLDPTKIYEQSVVDQRVDEALAEPNIEKKVQKKLTWFKKNYKKMEGGVFGNKLISRAIKEVENGKLVIDFEIV